MIHEAICPYCQYACYSGPDRSDHCEHVLSVRIDGRWWFGRVVMGTITGAPGPCPSCGGAGTVSDDGFGGKDVPCARCQGKGFVYDIPA